MEPLGGVRIVRCGTAAGWLIRLVVVLLVTTSLGISSGCSADREPPQGQPLTIAPTTLPGSAPVFVAEAKGYFRDEGLDPTVRTYPAGKVALSDALIGKVDVALVADTPIVRSILDGNDPVIIATIDRMTNTNYIVARTDRGISDATDLRGKRIGVLADTSADFFRHVYLVAASIEPSSAPVVPLKPDELVPSLVRGRVDAISAFAPYTIQAREQLGDNAIVLSDPALYTTTWNVVARRDLSEGGDDKLEAFLRAIERANAYIAEHPSEAQTITAKRTGIPIESIREEWDANQWTLSLDQSLVLTLEDEARWMSGNEGQTPDFLGSLHSAPLRRVSPEGVNIVEPRN